MSSPLPKPSSSLIPLPKDLPEFLAPFIPRLLNCKPFITLTYAQSLDSRIAAKKGERTTISHLETKTMTHYLRSHHDGILIGSGTALADDPGLNCRFKENGNQHTPRPIIVDPLFRWDFKGSKLQELVMKGESLEPWIIVAAGIEEKVQDKIEFLEKLGGKVIPLNLDSNNKLKWEDIFLTLKINGIDSIMVEGGAKIINQLLNSQGIVDSLIITIGPCFLGDQGVEVSPPQGVKLRNVHWWKGVQDTVMCANLID
ncbi:5-amino-6-(5-phosphoribosylamino)uracilreductase [Wickerhamomyces ciferrii]|uniref:2,5-diamino-6-ribosylamino-4(3H)-pyrimidinone 5'-phosphate reductase n=1 Tax=Wickerhamomyces ciferrii (strain ATCC 14091 / BCRC 22168 / CBS 111 / JCM 3599 / NBRC 0793 / NRRL Y-1031 F-60-10) TaxID=1206466 RepID=K0KKR0_WICCF|nr:5-amino-6-(5-phosphoribosylamino)uracilreductase [Wickerhamomyces ciferrii]CCH42742.1 5-amino-6-(5-phosphoribosylamino)uracilreductase [Wickerhamomyces ciferrii]